MHILLPETDNCPSWISRRERMTIENISWSISREWPLKIFHDQSPGKNVADLGEGWTHDLLVSSRTAHPTEPPRPAKFCLGKPKMEKKLLLYGPNHAKTCFRAWPRSDCVDRHSNQALHCLLTESPDTKECMKREQRSGWYFAHVQDDLNLHIFLTQPRYQVF